MVAMHAVRTWWQWHLSLQFCSYPVLDFLVHVFCESKMFTSKRDVGIQRKENRVSVAHAGLTCTANQCTGGAVVLVHGSLKRCGKPRTERPTARVFCLSQAFECDYVHFKLLAPMSGHSLFAAFVRHAESVQFFLLSSRPR